MQTCPSRPGVTGHERQKPPHTASWLNTGRAHRPAASLATTHLATTHRETGARLMGAACALAARLPGATGEGLWVLSTHSSTASAHRTHLAEGRQESRPLPSSPMRRPQTQHVRDGRCYTWPAQARSGGRGH